MVYLPLNSAGRSQRYFDDDDYYEDEIEEGLEEFEAEQEEEMKRRAEEKARQKAIEEEKQRRESNIREWKRRDKRDRNTGPEILDNFWSSHLLALAYDPAKRQLWIKFHTDGSVYTYYNIPIQIWKGFWAAPSKGKYFWAKIRRNPFVKYNKVSGSYPRNMQFFSAVHLGNVLHRGGKSLNAAKANDKATIKEHQKLLKRIHKYLSKYDKGRKWMLKDLELVSDDGTLWLESAPYGADLFIKPTNGRQYSVIAPPSTIEMTAYNLISAALR